MLQEEPVDISEHSSGIRAERRRSKKESFTFKEKIMYYGAVKNCDIANGIGIRISLFVSGCRNHCPGCFQPETWAFDYGNPYTKETEDHIIELMAPEYVDGLSILGGDPFEPENQKDVLSLIQRAKKLYPEKNIWIYTGYTYEVLSSGKTHPCDIYTNDILSLTDVLIDGPFIEEKKDITLQFRGSSNQRLIDMNETRKQGKVVLLKERKRGSFY